MYKELNKFICFILSACSKPQVYAASLLSVCITYLDTIRHIHTIGDTKFNSHNWTLKFRHTYTHTAMKERSAHDRNRNLHII